MNEIKFPFYARVAMILIAIVLAIFLLSSGKYIFIPLFSALLVSVLLLPLTQFLERRKTGRSLAAFISVILFIGFLVAVATLLIKQIVRFSKDIPQFQKRIQEIVAQIQQWIERNFQIDTQQQMAYINDSASSMLNTLTNSLGDILLSAVTVTVWTIFIFVYTFFMLYHRRLLLQFVIGLFKHGYHSRVHDVISDTRKIINHYVLGLLIEMVVMGIVNCSVFAIMGIPYPLLLGMLAAVLNIVPYLGIYTAMAIGVVITIANGTGNQTIALILALLIIHFIDVNILLPRIVGSRVKMNPLITIVAVLSGGLIWGIPGMFLFIPLVAILKIIFERVKGMQAWALLMGTEDKNEP
jgi:AI-2 transport protein TqsA